MTYQVFPPLILSHTSSLLKYCNLRNFSLSSPAGSKVAIKRVFTMHRLLDEHEFKSLPVDVLLPSTVPHSTYHVNPVIAKLKRSDKKKLGEGETKKPVKITQQQTKGPRFHDLPSKNICLPNNELKSKSCTSMKHLGLENLRGSSNFERVEYVESETQTIPENNFDILNEEDFSRSVTDAINVAEELQIPRVKI